MSDQVQVTVGPVGITGSGRAGISGAILILIVVLVWTYAYQQLVF